MDVGATLEGLVTLVRVPCATQHRARVDVEASQAVASRGHWRKRSEMRYIDVVSVCAYSPRSMWRATVRRVISGRHHHGGERF